MMRRTLLIAIVAVALILGGCVTMTTEELPGEWVKINGVSVHKKEITDIANPGTKYTLAVRSLSSRGMDTEEKVRLAYLAQEKKPSWAIDILMYAPTARDLSGTVKWRIDGELFTVDDPLPESGFSESGLARQRIVAPIPPRLMRELGDAENVRVQWFTEVNTMSQKDIQRVDKLVSHFGPGTGKTANDNEK